MTTVAHSTLSGSDLHDAKGVATATSGQVYVANGSGTGVWSTLTNAFSNSRLHVQYQVSQNTSDTVMTAATWQTRNLNTIITNDISATLGTNQLTLASGTYFIFARVPIGYTVVNSVNMHGQARLFNVSSSAVSVTGNHQKFFCISSSVSLAMNQDSWVTGMFTATGTQIFALQSYQDVSAAAFPGNITTEVYTDVNIWKIT